MGNVMDNVVPTVNTNGRMCNIYDARTGGLKRQISTNKPIKQAYISGDCVNIITEGNRTEVWNWKTGGLVRTIG